MKKTLLTIEIFKYDRSEYVDCDDQSAQELQFEQYELPKHGGSLLKMKLRVTLNSSCPRRHYTKYDRAIIDTKLQVAGNEDQNHSCPMQEKEDERVLSLAWMKRR